MGEKLSTAVDRAPSYLRSTYDRVEDVSRPGRGQERGETVARVLDRETVGCHAVDAGYRDPVPLLRAGIANLDNGVATSKKFCTSTEEPGFTAKCGNYEGPERTAIRAVEHEVAPVGTDRKQGDTRQAFQNSLGNSRSDVAKIYSSRARGVTTIDHDIRDHLSIGRDRRRMSPARVRDLPAVRKRDLVRNGITSISTF